MSKSSNIICHLLIFCIFIPDVLCILQSPLSKGNKSDQEYDYSIPMVEKTIDAAWPTRQNNRYDLSKGI